MRQRILVTGGTGTLGRVVVHRLLERGGQVRVLSRHGRLADMPAAVEWMVGDLVRGEGLEAAVAGVGVIVHGATDVRRPRADIDATRNLVETARAWGTPHLVYVSIVGVDTVPLGYYRAKLAAEQVVEGSGLPWTILRATQFHDLVLRVAATLARLPVMPVPAGTSLQPVDVGEVAARLADIATGEPSGRVPEMGGPHVRDFAGLMRAYLTARGRRRLIVPVRVPGAVAAAYRSGGHLTPQHATGRRSWEEFLADRYGPRTRSSPKYGGAADSRS